MVKKYINNVLTICMTVFFAIMSVCFLFLAVMILTDIICTSVAKKKAEPSSLKVAYEQALSEEGSVWVAEEIDAWFAVSDYYEEKHSGRAYGKIFVDNQWEDAVLLIWNSRGKGDEGILSTDLVDEDGHETIFVGGNITFTENEIIYEGFSSYIECFNELDNITYKKLDSLSYGNGGYWSEKTDIEFELFSNGIFEMERDKAKVKGLLQFDYYDIILEVSENETYVFNRGENGDLIYVESKSNNEYLMGEYVFH